jgi:hypothetical protein
VARPKPIADTLRELWELLQAYARQEAIDPLKPLGRYLGYGIGGMVLIGVGLVYLGLSGLRAMQSQTDLFEGTWSFVPYLIVVVVLGVIVAVALSRVDKAQRDARGGDGDRTPGTRPQPESTR